ncbi:TetR/AcrR family transcriptional regulator [Paenibacillus sp. NPDC057934]|uniref:TetR/AcrR family transcriptional regulator n=1 Tax=Paenibacillus sp. NPDC057934 TaxID=3346282 RepID=UPI0036DA847E
MKIRKGEKTKQYVIEKTSLLLNQRGYLSTSLAEVTDATGLQKGGLYNHFRDKEDLMIESFKYNCTLITERIEPAIASASTAADKLNAFVETYLDLDFPGGCPIANAAVEAEAVSPLLFQHAQEAMDRMLVLLEDIINTGIAQREFRSDANPRNTAVVILSLIEGGLLMNKLLPFSPFQLLKDQLSRYINEELK